MALITALMVVLVGVEQGIILAIVLSLIDHTRRGYRPKNVVLVPAEIGCLACAAGGDQGSGIARPDLLPVYAQHVLRKLPAAIGRDLKYCQRRGAAGALVLPRCFCGRRCGLLGGGDACARFTGC